MVACPFPVLFWIAYLLIHLVQYFFVDRRLGLTSKKMLVKMDDIFMKLGFYGGITDESDGVLGVSLGTY